MACHEENFFVGLRVHGRETKALVENTRDMVVAKDAERDSARPGDRFGARDELRAETSADAPAPMGGCDDDSAEMYGRRPEYPMLAEPDNAVIGIIQEIATASGHCQLPVE